LRKLKVGEKKKMDQRKLKKRRAIGVKRCKKEKTEITINATQRHYLGTQLGQENSVSRIYRENISCCRSTKKKFC
jgi:hypothetical protein